jgi:hypothetical protein
MTIPLQGTPTLLTPSAILSTPTVAAVSNLGNNQCLLPCWHRITPGVSSVLDLDLTSQFLLGMPLSRGSGVFQDHPYVTTFAFRDFSIGDTKINLSVGTYSHPDSDVVDVLDISANVLKHGQSDETKGKAEYWQLFRDYSLQNILSAYGIPDDVLIFAETYDEDLLKYRDALHIRLLYVEKGIFVSYDMPLKEEDVRGIACLTNSEFRLWLTSPDTSQYYQEWWESAQGYTDFSQTFKTPIEEALQLTLAEFFDKFKEQENACLETPLGIW